MCVGRGVHIILWEKALRGLRGDVSWVVGRYIDPKLFRVFSMPPPVTQRSHVSKGLVQRLESCWINGGAEFAVSFCGLHKVM